jgi:acyl carrier protein
MTFDRIRTLLARQFEVSSGAISMDTNIIDDLGADSLDIVELITSIEEEFGIIITDESAHELYTVRQVVDFIEKLI